MNKHTYFGLFPSRLQCGAITDATRTIRVRSVVIDNGVESIESRGNGEEQDHGSEKAPRSQSQMTGHYIMVESLSGSKRGKNGQTSECLHLILFIRVLYLLYPLNGLQLKSQIKLGHKSQIHDTIHVSIEI